MLTEILRIVFVSEHKNLEKRANFYIRADTKLLEYFKWQDLKTCANDKLASSIYDG